jgi:hypothetical protein
MVGLSHCRHRLKGTRAEAGDQTPAVIQQDVVTMVQKGEVGGLDIF